MMMTPDDPLFERISPEGLAWVAGFLEGEGYFILHHNSPCVGVHQVQRWPLDTLRELVGGNHLTQRKGQRPGWSRQWVWRMYGPNAVALMRKLHPFLSPKRQEQIGAVLTKWSPKQRWRAQCVHGHDKVLRHGRMVCNVCNRDKARRRRAALAA